MRRAGAASAALMILCLSPVHPLNGAGDQDDNRPPPADPPPTDQPTDPRPQDPSQPGTPPTQDPPPPHPVPGQQPSPTPVEPVPEPRQPLPPPFGDQETGTPLPRPAPVRPDSDRERWWDTDLTPPADAPACTCACEVDISGPDRFTRHWKNPDWYKPGGTNEVCYQANTRWHCPKGTELGSTDCRFKWQVPEWRGRITGPYVSDTICFDAPPQVVIDELKKTGKYRLSLRAEASCSYHCYLDKELYSRSTDCTGNKTVTVVACKTDKDAEQAAKDCEALKQPAGALLQQVDGKIQEAQTKRKNMEAAVQVYGSMIPIACQGLEAAGAECAWATTLEWINLGIQIAATLSTAGLGLAEGFATQLDGAVQSLTMTLATQSEDSWDTEQCDDLLNTMRSNLVTYKIKACEHVKGFRDVCKGLDDLAQQLESLLSKARNFSACRYCDLGDIIKKLEDALKRVKAEAQQCHAAAKKYGAWIDYCEGDSQYTTDTADQICDDAPPVP